MRVIPNWDMSVNIVDAIEGLRARFDLSKGVPMGWRLLRGKAVKRHIDRALREEARYQREQTAKRDGGAA
jgi:hypothetical protein